jgi:hypothetical protein
MQLLLQIQPTLRTKQLSMLRLTLYSWPFQIVSHIQRML